MDGKLPPIVCVSVITFSETKCDVDLAVSVDKRIPSWVDKQNDPKKHFCGVLYIISQIYYDS